MQSFALIKNALITEVDNRATEPSLSAPLKNTLKTLVKTTIATNYGSDSIYNKKTSIEIPRSSYDNLSQLYLKLVLSTSNVACTAEPYLAAKIFKSIRFQTRNGVELQTIVPEYTHARIDEIHGTALFTQIENGLEPDVTFLAGNPTLVVPLFFFFSENESCFLNTRDLETLELVLTTNDSKESMGLSADLTSMTVELYSCFHDTNSSNKYSDRVYNSVGTTASKLLGSFNIFREDTLVCASGTTSAKLLLRCPHPLYVLHTSLVNSTTQRAQIKTLKLTVGGNVLIDLDYRLNYSIYGEQKAIIENGTVSLYFSKLKNRTVDSGLIIFSDQMFPVYLEITYDSSESDYTLYAIEEYRTNYAVSKEGVIGLSNDASYLNQGNSSTEKATLVGT